MSFLSPSEIIAQVRGTARTRVELSVARTLLLAIYAGAFIAFGGLLAIKIGGGMPAIKEANPGLASFAFGAVFPFGLMMVIIAGAELFTGNNALLIPAWYNKEVTTKEVLRNWGLSYLGNLIGSLFVAYFFVSLTGIVDVDPWLSTTQSIAESKVNQPMLSLFFKAIACNWLVCIAVWMATASKSTSGKILSIWFPIMAFVAIGFEHSVANMFFIPLGIFSGADVTWSQFVLNNLLIVTAGNLVGGALFVGLGYSFVYAKK